MTPVDRTIQAHAAHVYLGDTAEKGLAMLLPVQRAASGADISTPRSSRSGYGSITKVNSRKPYNCNTFTTRQHR